MVVYTGGRRHAATRSNVYFMVSGEEHETEVRKLEDTTDKKVLTAHAGSLVHLPFPAGFSHAFVFTMTCAFRRIPLLVTYFAPSFATITRKKNLYIDAVLGGNGDLGQDKQTRDEQTFWISVSIATFRGKWNFDLDIWKSARRSELGRTDLRFVSRLFRGVWDPDWVQSLHFNFKFTPETNWNSFRIEWTNCHTF